MRALALTAILTLATTACSGGSGGGAATTASSTTNTTPSNPSTSSTTSTAPAPVAPTGFQVHGGPDQGFEIALPESFRIIDLEEEDLETMFTDTDLSPEVQEVVSAAVDQPGQFALWAFDFVHAESNFVPNVNVIRSERTPFDEPGVYVDVIPSQYEQLGASLLSIEETDLGFGPVVLVESLFPIGSGAFSHAFQMVAMSDDSVFFITYSFEDPTEADRLTVLDSFSTLALFGD